MFLLVGANRLGVRIKPRKNHPAINSAIFFSLFLVLIFSDILSMKCRIACYPLLMNIYQ